MNFDNNKRIKKLVKRGKKFKAPRDNAQFGGLPKESKVRPTTSKEVKISGYDASESDPYAKIVGIFARQIINESRYAEAIAINPDLAEKLGKVANGEKDYAFNMATIIYPDIDFCSAYAEARKVVMESNASIEPIL